MEPERDAPTLEVEQDVGGGAPPAPVPGADAPARAPASDAGGPAPGAAAGGDDLEEWQMVTPGGSPRSTSG
jgi:hypothetical protein